MGEKYLWNVANRIPEKRFNDSKPNTGSYPTRPIAS